MHRFVGPLAALAGSLIAATALAGPVAAAPGAVASAAPAAAPVAFEVQIGSPCFLVDGPPRARGMVTVRTPGGRIRGQVDVNLGKDGQVIECIFAILTGINGGDSIAFRSGDLRVRWTVPRLSLTADRDSDTYTVAGPVGAQVSVDGTRGQYLGKLSMLFGYDELTIDADGSVRHDPGVDLQGTDWLMASHDVGQNTVTAMAFVPFIRVQDGDRLVSGAVGAGSPVQVTLTRDGQVRARNVGAELVQGQFYATLAGPGGGPAYVRAGDRITVTGASRQTMKMPVMGVSGDPAADTVAGRCFPGARYALSAEAPFSGFRSFHETLWGRAGADGTISRRLKGDLRRSDELLLRCQNANGDVAEVARIVPR